MHRVWIAAAAGALVSGCGLINSLESTYVAGGMVLATPEVKFSLAGRPAFVAVPATTEATSYVGRRSSATATDLTPIGNATVKVTFGASSATLGAVSSDSGLYQTTLSQPYAGGTSYTFAATLPGDDTGPHGGSVTAPDQLQAALLTLAPAGNSGTILGGQTVFAYPQAEAINVTWPSSAGSIGFATVLEIDFKNSTSKETYDNRPRTAADFVRLALGTEPTTISIPATAFPDHAYYALLLFTLNKASPQANTFIGSPLLAGSGVALTLAVGNPSPP